MHLCLAASPPPTHTPTHLPTCHLIGCSRLAPRMTMARTLKLYKLADQPVTPGLRQMEARDVPQVRQGAGASSSGGGVEGLSELQPTMARTAAYRQNCDPHLLDCTPTDVAARSQLLSVYPTPCLPS